MERRDGDGDSFSVRDGVVALPNATRQVQARGDRVECTVDSSEKRLPEILRWLADHGVSIRDCQVHEPELEEVFVELAR